MASGALLVTFLDQERRLGPEEQLSFGRLADLVVDEDNQYMSGLVGRFFWWNGLWWLENLGNKVELTLLGADRVTVRLPPGAQAPIVIGVAAVRFKAGGLPYAVEVELSSTPGPPPSPLPKPPGAATRSFGYVHLTPDERSLLVELARPFLLDAANGPDSLPSNGAVARRLGWGAKKLNRTLDYLCVRLTKAGVRGLQGSRDNLAVNRRWVLVEHAVAEMLVTADDL